MVGPAPILTREDAVTWEHICDYSPEEGSLIEIVCVTDGEGNCPNVAFWNGNSYVARYRAAQPFKDTHWRYAEESVQP